ncbi:DNA polymerase processivity factor [Vibrio phage D479]
MKLSKTTIDVLKNFASINNGMVIHEGSRIRTQDNLNKQIAFADIDDSFPMDFAVYDLGEFLSALALVPEAELTFHESFVEVSNPSTSLTFQYANMAFVTEAPEKVNFPQDGVVDFEVRGEDLTQVLKASSTLGLPEIRVSSEMGTKEIQMSAVDAEGASKHTFKINVGETKENEEFEFFFKSDLLTIVKQDYRVSIHPAGIGRFVGLNLEYFIATEAH